MVVFTWEQLASRGLAKYFRFPQCACFGVGYELGILVCGNEVRQYKLRCCGCGYRNPATVSHKLLTAEERETAEVWQVNEPTYTPPCERCGAPEPTQEHQWAPQALFTDADEWPTAWLCQKCHSRYHQIMTPCDLYRIVKQA
jgi:hypothetical protein